MIKNKKIKRIKIIFMLVVALFLIMFCTDSINQKKSNKPIFAIETKMYEDGGSIKYVGLFYNYYKIVKISPDINLNESREENCYIVDYVITPWFFDIDYARKKAFK